jgi:hypothetical protein
MNKTKSVLLSFLLLPIVILAQDEFTIDLNRATAILQLNGYHIAGLADVRSERVYIGYVQTGIGNKQVPARLGTSFKGELSKFLDRSGATDGENRPLTLRVNKLYIHEITTTSSETSFITLNVSFLEQTDSGWVELFQAGVLRRRGGMDVTGQHADNIAAAFQQCFTDFNNRLRQGRLRPKLIPDSTLQVNPLDVKGYFPVFKIKSFPKAIFPSFYDFRDYFPDTETPFTIDYKTNKKDSLLLAATLKLPDGYEGEDPWGFSDGKNLFIRIGKKYYLIRERKGEFVSNVMPKDLSSDIASGVTAAGIAGGLIGAALASGMAALAATSSSAVERGTFRLDFSARTLLPLDLPDFMEIRSHSIFYLSKLSPEESPVCLFVNETFHVKLTPGQYYDLTLNSEAGEISVVIVTADGSRAEKVFFPRLFNTDVFLVRAKKGKITIGTTFGDVRRDILYDMGPDNTAERSRMAVPQGTCP